jgi:RimJ/RimL family protein N-acetyltransferase
VKEFSMDYLNDLFALYEEPGMTDHMEGLYPYEKEREYEQAYIDNMYRFYGYGMWIVIEKETGKLIGRAGVEHREDLGGELELGYAISAAYQGKGYAMEVCSAILAYARDELGFREICCLIEPDNERSISFAGKLGFKLLGTIFTGGKNMQKYAILL